MKWDALGVSQIKGSLMANRDANGRFVKGHAVKGGGRRRRPTEERYLSLFKKAVTDEDATTIIMTAIARAKAGDDKARAFLFDRLIGKPTVYVAADVTTGGEVLQFPIIKEIIIDRPADDEPLAGERERPPPASA